MIIDKQNRSKLAEGRNYGFGFSILKKVDDKTYEALMPFTACKDYLNDFIYVETTKKPLGIIYGFKHEYTGVFEDQEYFYLGYKSVDKNKSSGWDKLNETKELIVSNYTNVIKFFNKLEEFLDMSDRTEFESLEEDTVILKVPMYWTKYTFLISVYLLYIRCFSNVTEEELELDIIKLINADRKAYLNVDDMLYKASVKWVSKEYLDKIFDYSYPNNPSGSQIHNYGISGRVQELSASIKNKKEVKLSI